MRRLVDKDHAAFALVVAEFYDINRICDACKIPRQSFGETLTTAQRVEMLARCRKEFQQ